jgi:hypothetical protein
MIEHIKFSKSETVWQFFLFWIVIFVAVEAPLSYSLKLNPEVWQLWLEGIFSLFFISDFIINLKKKNYEKAAWYYILVDILSCVPWDLLAINITGHHLFHILRLVRIVRVVKMVRIYSTLGSMTYLPGPLKVHFVIVWSLVLTHWISCGWLLVHRFDTAMLLDSYILAVYWSVTTLTTIGYGDITPDTNVARLFTMVIMILGVAVYGIVIGNIAKMMTMADRYKERSREKLNDISLFMKHYNIPQKIQRDVFSFYNHLFTKRLSDNDTKIISELPHALQSELQIYMNLKLISTVPVFAHCTQPCLKMIAASLEQIYFSPGNKVIEKGEIGKEMYIIGHGIVEIVGQDNSVVATLQEGQFFGESSLIEEAARNADVRAKTYCDLYRLSKEDFLHIIKTYPGLLDDMKRVMRRRSGDR